MNYAFHTSNDKINNGIDLNVFVCNVSHNINRKMNIFIGEIKNITNKFYNLFFNNKIILTSKIIVQVCIYTLNVLGFLNLNKLIRDRLCKFLAHVKLTFVPSIELYLNPEGSYH